MFADRFLLKKNIPQLILQSPPNDLNIIVVIPCFNEPDILTTLKSLCSCTYNHSVEVIIIINSAISTDLKIINQNNITYIEINNWISNISHSNISFLTFNITDLPDKDAGVGFARKIGMDEAVQRFNKINKPKGIIVSLDADTICEENYFTEIENFYLKTPKANGCNIYFEHSLESEKFTDENYVAITKYELYLRYYYQSLKNIGFPYYYHTVGSCFSVTANAYVMQGGMNKKKAGEDFYFLQKIFSMGNFGEITSTCVYPSERPSDRVPFGTGPTINKFINSEIDDILTYNIEAFNELKELFKIHKNLFKCDNFNLIINKLPAILVLFLNQINFDKLISEINNNCTTEKVFSKKFFNVFNAFRIIKFLNFAHKNYYQKKDIFTLAKSLLSELNIDTKNITSEKKILIKYRKLELLAYKPCDF